MSDCQETFNLWLTLSFADLHDPQLHRLLPGSEAYLGKTVVASLSYIPEDADAECYIDSATDNRMRADAVAKNGDIVSLYLNRKFWLFYEHILVPMGVVDYILRVEFQWR